MEQPKTDESPLAQRPPLSAVLEAVAGERGRQDGKWGGRTPPTFHELRSLSERLYRDQGINTQALLGHRHARMTEVYNDPRGAEWGTVKLA